MSLALQSQLESKNAPLQRVLGLLQSGPADRSEPDLCGQCFLPARCPIPSRAWSAFSRTKCIPKSWRPTSLLAVQSRNSALLWSLLLQWEQQEGRQQLLLLTAFTNAHLLCMVGSERLIKSSVGHVRATQMVKSLLWIYKMLCSLKNCLRLGNQSKSFFGYLIFFSSPNWTVRTVCYVLQKWSVGMT